ncbi:threonine synthase [Candidatus Saccharibacteria bacterium]|nr:threonine synthase [Candidatus Saccharibacteria bacterium]
MKFVSLHNRKDIVTFEQALYRGIPADGSLYHPEHMPELTEGQTASLSGLDAKAVDFIMLKAWVGDEIPDKDLRGIVETAATFETPTVKVADKYILELFHGPTLAFKDVAAHYLAAFMGYFNTKHKRTSTVLVATSGDTGGAIAHGFADVSGVSVVVLYPKGRVSQMQQDQLRRVADNVRSVEVEGDFDDCQALVKAAFADEVLATSVGLTSANSISIGRLIPQTLYYARAYAQLGREDMRVVVPCGNLGNLTAGVMAQQIGVPISTFLAANNVNDALYRYSNLGRYHPLKTVHTLSSAMDVGAPNNMPRLRRLFDDSVRRMRSDIQVAHCTDEQTVKTIKQVYDETGYLLDPHTAVAWCGAEEFPPEHEVDLIVSTASPLKFSEEILKYAGITVDNSAELKRLRQTPERYVTIRNSLDDLKAVMQQK